MKEYEMIKFQLIEISSNDIIVCSGNDYGTGSGEEIDEGSIDVE